MGGIGRHPGNMDFPIRGAHIHIVKARAAKGQQLYAALIQLLNDFPAQHIVYKGDHHIIAAREICGILV